MRSNGLGYTKKLTHITDLDAAQGAVTAALSEAGFGVITEIDVQATVLAKLGLDMRPYKILGACNPGMAHRALEADAFIGLLLPCNVILFEDDEGQIVVSFARPGELFKLVDRPEMGSLAEQVDGMIRGAFEAL